MKNLPKIFNPLSAIPTNRSHTLKQFVDSCRRIVWVCLAILWGWRLKGSHIPVGAQELLFSDTLCNEVAISAYPEFY